jgi:hypothetical protein
VGAFTQAGAPKTEGEALQILAAIGPLFTQHAGPSTQPNTSARRALVIMMALAQPELLAS